jgi:hypothetical protein
MMTDGGPVADEQRTVAAVIPSRNFDGLDWLMAESPGALRGLGELFFELARPPLAEVRICSPASTGTGGNRSGGSLTSSAFCYPICYPATEFNGRNDLNLLKSLVSPSGFEPETY